MEGPSCWSGPGGPPLDPALTAGSSLTAAPTAQSGPHGPEPVVGVWDEWREVTAPPVSNMSPPLQFIWYQFVVVSVCRQKFGQFGQFLVKYNYDGLRLNQLLKEVLCLLFYY